MRAPVATLGKLSLHSGLLLLIKLTILIGVKLLKELLVELSLASLKSGLDGSLLLLVDLTVLVRVELCHESSFASLAASLHLLRAELGTLAAAGLTLGLGATAAGLACRSATAGLTLGLGAAAAGLACRSAAAGLGRGSTEEMRLVHGHTLLAGAGALHHNHNGLLRSCMVTTMVAVVTVVATLAVLSMPLLSLSLGACRSRSGSLGRFFLRHQRQSRK